MVTTTTVAFWRLWMEMVARRWNGIDRTSPIGYHELSCTQPYDSQLVYWLCSYLPCTAKYVNACNLCHALWQLYAPSWWGTITVDIALVLLLLLLQWHFVRRIGCCQRGGGSGFSDLQCCCCFGRNNEFINGEEYTLRRWPKRSPVGGVLGVRRRISSTGHQCRRRYHGWRGWGWKWVTGGACCVWFPVQS